MSEARRVAVSTAAQVAGRVGALVLTVVIAGILSRHLGASSFGVYSNAILYGAIASVVCDLGLSTIGIRELEMEGSTLKTGDLVRMKTLMQLPLFAVFAALSFALPVPGAHTGLVALGIATSAVVSIQSSLSIYLQQQVRLGLLGGVEIGTRVLQLALVLVVVARAGSVRAAVLVSLAAAAAAALAVFAIVVRSGADLRGRFDLAGTRMLLLRCLPLAFVTTLGYLHFKADSVILSILKAPRELGVYSVAYRLIELCVALPGLFLASALPLLVRSFHVRDSRNRNAQRCFDALTITGLPFMLGVFVCAPALVRLVGGDAFDAAALPLRLLALASLFAWFNALFSTLAILADLQHRLLLVSAVALAVNIGVNVAVIPHYSYRGAAATTLATEGLGFVWILVLTLRALDLRLDLARWPRTLLACVAAGGTAWPLGRSPLSPLVFMVVCLCLLWMLRVVRADDIKQLVGPAASA